MAHSDFPAHAAKRRSPASRDLPSTATGAESKGVTALPGTRTSRRPSETAALRTPGTPANAGVPRDLDRYGQDVLTASLHPRSPRVPEVLGEPGMVVECATSGWCGEIMDWERTASGWAVVLEDRRGARRLFPPDPASFLLEGVPVTLIRPKQQVRQRPQSRTASGSLGAAPSRAKVARASRIWVEGRQDAELVEKVWGCDLREIGIVVEELGGIDDLRDRIRDFQPSRDRRLVVLVDHLVAGSKEWRIAESVERSWAPHVRVLGHPYVDVWQAVTPRALGIRAWPEIPKGQSWKEGVCQALGWPPDPAAAWRLILSRVHSYTDLEPALLGRVEEAIDLVTADQG